MLNVDNTLSLIRASRREGGNEAVYTNLHSEVSKLTHEVSRDRVIQFAGPILDALDRLAGDEAQRLTQEALDALKPLVQDERPEDEAEPAAPEGSLADLQNRVSKLERIAQERGLL